MQLHIYACMYVYMYYIGTLETLKLLYDEGGIPRLYQGTVLYYYDYVILCYTTLCYAMVYYAIFLSSNQLIYLSIDYALYATIRVMYNEDCYLIRSL